MVLYEFHTITDACEARMAVAMYMELAVSG
jgi:hypothetical protein